MSPIDDFLTLFQKNTTTGLVPSQLGLDRDGNLHWLYYGGMGETNCHQLSQVDQQIAKEAMAQQLLVVSDDTRTIPVFDEQGVMGEVVFKLIIKAS